MARLIIRPSGRPAADERRLASPSPPLPLINPIYLSSGFVILSISGECDVTDATVGSWRGPDNRTLST